MRIITFDIETTNLFQDVGSNDPRDLNIAVVCIHDSLDNSYQSFEVHEFGKLWPIIENSDALVTWNGDHFDIPLLDKYYPGDLTKLKSIDLMREVQLKLGRRLKLDTVAEATLGTRKSGHGLDAIEWWKNGEKDKVIKYCIDDVKLTRQLYDYAREHKLLKYRDNGELKSIRLDVSGWDKVDPVSMTFTLPF
jgi:DEAD/DEAH box helicase domain-containing protein